MFYFLLPITPKPEGKSHQCHFGTCPSPSKQQGCTEQPKNDLFCSFSDAETIQFSVTFGNIELCSGSFSLQLATAIQRGLKKQIQKGTKSIIMT